LIRIPFKEIILKANWFASKQIAKQIIQSLADRLESKVEWIESNCSREHQPFKEDDKLSHLECLGFKNKMKGFPSLST